MSIRLSILNGLFTFATIRDSWQCNVVIDQVAETLNAPLRLLISMWTGSFDIFMRRAARFSALVRRWIGPPGMFGTGRSRSGLINALSLFRGG
jgi:hypothetical protein